MKKISYNNQRAWKQLFEEKFFDLLFSKNLQNILVYIYRFLIHRPYSSWLELDVGSADFSRDIENSEEGLCIDPPTLHLNKYPHVK